MGLGKTGLSCARYLSAMGMGFSVVDSRNNPPLLAEFRKEFPDVSVSTGEFSESDLAQATQLIVSPGISLKHPVIEAAASAGAEITGDIDIFCRSVSKPVVAITGSNAKSTVTTLVGEMLQGCGLRVAVGGNIGTPALDLLRQGDVDIYVLELSSFQLETSHNLAAEVATVLNISEDHMDRYDGLQQYHQAKHRIFRGCRAAIVNRDDPLSSPLVDDSVRLTSFGLGVPDLGQFGVISHESKEWLSLGTDPLLPVDDLKIPGRHNISNALVALAIVHSLHLPLTGALHALKNFNGLPHRCQWVAEINGITYINDSKATNNGAALAAIEGIGKSITGKILLIAGGDGKGADFSPLKPAIEKYVKRTLLIGRDAPLMARTFAGTPIEHCDSLQLAVTEAAKQAGTGDVVLLSPACASFDMFSGFEQRGEMFMRAVQEVTHD